MKKNMLLVMTLLLMSNLGAQTVPNEVQAIIQAALAGGNLMANFNTYKTEMGFDKNTNLSDIQAADPIKLYTITYQQLLSYTNNVPIQTLLTDVQVWKIPFTVNGKYICFLDIAKVNNVWVPSTIGSNPVARAWQQIIQSWPKQNGFNSIYIEVFGLGKMFFHIPEKDQYNLTELNPMAINPSNAIGKTTVPDYSNTTSGADILPKLKTAVQNDNEGGF